MYVGTGTFLNPFLYAMSSSFLSPKKLPTHSRSSNGPDFLLIVSTRWKNCLNFPDTSPQTRLYGKINKKKILGYVFMFKRNYYNYLHLLFVHFILVEVSNSYLKQKLIKFYYLFNQNIYKHKNTSRKKLDVKVFERSHNRLVIGLLALRCLAHIFKIAQNYKFLFIFKIFITFYVIYLFCPFIITRFSIR